MDPKTDKTQSDYPGIPVIGYTSIRNSDIVAYEELIEDLSFINKKEFENIYQKYSTGMSMAVNAKEQRELLFKFFSLDWKGLGIDVPLDLNFEEMSIKNGVINSGTKLLK